MAHNSVKHPVLQAPLHVHDTCQAHISVSRSMHQPAALAGVSCSLLLALPAPSPQLLDMRVPSPLLPAQPLHPELCPPTPTLTCWVPAPPACPPRPQGTWPGAEPAPPPWGGPAPRSCSWPAQQCPCRTAGTEAVTADMAQHTVSIALVCWDHGMPLGLPLDGCASHMWSHCNNAKSLWHERAPCTRIANVCCKILPPIIRHNNWAEVDWQSL